MCHPIRGKVLCTETRAKRVIAAVSIICILATASTSFEYQLTTRKQCLQKECPATESPTPLETVQEYEDNFENETINKDTINSLDPTDPETIMAEENLLIAEDEEYIEYLQSCDGNSSCFNNTGIQDNETELECCLNKILIHTELTHLGLNKTYRKVFYWFSSVSFAFLPLIIIATINCFLVNAVRKSRKERKKMTKSQVRNGFHIFNCATEKIKIYFLAIAQTDFLLWQD